MSKKHPSTEMATALIQFRGGELADELCARHDHDDRSTGARRDIARYYWILSEELAKVALSDAEVKLFVQLTSGTEWTPQNIGLLGPHLERDGKHRKVAGAKGLATKIEALGAAARMALVDGAERLRRAGGADVPGIPGLRIAGLFPRAVESRRGRRRARSEGSL